MFEKSFPKTVPEILKKFRIFRYEKVKLWYRISEKKTRRVRMTKLRTWLENLNGISTEFLRVISMNACRYAETLVSCLCWTDFKSIFSIHCWMSLSWFFVSIRHNYLNPIKSGKALLSIWILHSIILNSLSWFL